MTCRALFALLFICAAHLAFATPQGPDIIVEEKPQVIVQTVVENVLIPVEEYINCYRDNIIRDLPHMAHSGSNSVPLCANACRRLGFKFAGVQNSNECWCGQSFGRYGLADNCNMKCTSDSNQICGGPWANNVYRVGLEPPKAEGPLGYYGCYRDNGNRDLPKLIHSGPQSIESCKIACKNGGFRFAGVQYSHECWCGNSFGRYGKADNCNMKCSGNHEQICGGTWANGVYVAGVSEASEDESKVGLRGCFLDNGDRDLPHLAFTGSNSVKLCKTACQNAGFKYAGLQFSSYCFCGNFYGRYGRSNNCNMKCSGRVDQICGGSWANTVYRIDSWAPPVPEGTFGHLGCYKDNANRDLPHLAHAGSNSIELCIAACRNLGFKYAGVQYSSHCFCGNFYGKYGKGDNCNMKCTSNSEQICGGGWASNVYVAGSLEDPQPEEPLGHYGCYKDNGNRDLPHLAYAGSNSVEQCKTACNNLGFKYAGVQFSSYCFCGNFFGKYGKGDNCNMKCTTNSQQICGGGWSNNIYRAAP